jgi:hypothetical protein
MAKAVRTFTVVLKNGRKREFTMEGYAAYLKQCDALKQKEIEYEAELQAYRQKDRLEMPEAMWQLEARS